MKRLLMLVCALAMVQTACTAALGADEISYVVPVPLSPTNWTQPVIVPMFDPALGTLLGVEFTMSGHVEGIARFESLDAAPTVVTMNLWADIALMRPDYTLIVMVSPLAATMDAVTAFDGSLDFDGTSGKTYEGLMADLTTYMSVPPPNSDLALFTGTGPGDTINLWAGAWGYCIGSGSGNLVVWFNTLASAEATVKYIYEPIPEPSSLLALLAGLGSLSGLAVLRKR